MAGALLVGCGGGSSSMGGGGGGGVGTTNVSVGFGLPKGLTAANQQLLTGYSAVTGLGGNVGASVTAGYVTLAMVVDTSVNKLVLIGMIDPTATSNTMNAANAAATLLFLKAGGNQLTGTLRNTLWKLIVADPATATFTAVVTARLAANPYALDAGDAQINAALTTAYNSLQAATLAAANPTLQTTKVLAASRDTLPPTPTPGVSITFGLFPEAQVVAYSDAQGNDYADYISILYQQFREGAYYIYEVGRTDSSGVTTQTNPPVKILGPISVQWPDVSVIRTGAQTVPLANPTDDGRNLEMIFFSPIFDASTPTIFSNAKFAGEVAEWKATLAAMFQREAILVANTLLLEALGLGGVSYTVAQLMTETTQLIALGGPLATAIAAASAGTSIFTTVNAITTAASTNVTVAFKVLNILQPLVSTPIVNPTTRVTQLSMVEQIYRVFNLWGYGRVVVDSENGIGSPYTTVDSVTGSVVAVTYTLTPSSTTYTPAGAAITLTTTSAPNVDNALRQYQWTLSGSGNCTLSDGAGHTGTTITTATPSVKFTAPAGATGVQSIKVEVYNTESGTAVLSGSAHTDLNGATSNIYGLFPAAGTCQPSATIPLTVGYSDGDVNITLTNLSFIWAVTSSIGGFVSGNSTVQTITTDTNTVNFQVIPAALEGQTISYQVTVRKTDPTTGNYTNLAVLPGTINVQIGAGCQIGLAGLNFPVSDLWNQAEWRFLQPVTTYFGNDSSGNYVFNVTYAPAGGSTSGDYVAVTLNTGTNEPGQGSVIDLNSTSKVTVDLGRADAGGEIAYTFYGSGTVRIDDLEPGVNKGGGNPQTYALFSAVLACSDPVDNFSCTASLSFGMGVPPDFPLA